MLIQTQFAKFLLILLLALPLVARAASVDAPLDWPTLNADVQRLQTEGHSDQAFSLLLSVENQLSGTPDFDYALGVLALELGQYGLAQVSLERVVLVSPNHAGAWLDLAIASFKLGEVDAAQQIIRHIEENFNPPAPLRDELNRVKKQLAVGSIAQGWHGGVIASYGYVQNPNSGLSDSRFSLTPTGSTPIAVEVDGSMRPKADDATQLRANLYRTYQHASGAESTLSSAVLIKTYAQQKDFNLIDAMLAWDYRQPIFQEGGWTLNLSPMIRTIAFGGETLGYFTTLSAGVTKKYQSCELGGRLDLEKRNYVKDNYFNATTPWLGATLGCMRNNMLFGAGVRYGKDFGEASRPGGHTQKLEANAYWRTLLSERVTLGLAAYAAEYLDGEGYSTLLDYNNRRSIHRLSQRAELVWQLPTSTHWALQAEVERARDRSNIPTARIEDMQILLGLRYQFN